MKKPAKRERRRLRLTAAERVAVSELLALALLLGTSRNPGARALRACVAERALRILEQKSRPNKFTVAQIVECARLLSEQDAREKKPRAKKKGDA